MDAFDVILLIVAGLTIAVDCWAAVSGYLWRRRRTKQTVDVYDDDLFDSDDLAFRALGFAIWGALISTIGYALVAWQMGWAWAHFWGWQDVCFFGVIPVSVACVYGLAADPDNFDWLVGVIIVAVCAVGYLIGQILWPLVVAVCGYFLIGGMLKDLWSFLQGLFYSLLASGEPEGD